LNRYQVKHHTVEARQHEGPKIVVNSELKGNQQAYAGDYLVTDANVAQPRGSIFVVAKAEFEHEYEPVDATEEAKASSDALLAAARNALRSYEHGNTATALAKEVADAITEHLGEDAPAQATK
jgi:hypothetical protein